MSNAKITLTETITDWAASRPDEVVLDPKKGYYSFDIVLDAYNKGREETKEQVVQDLKSQFRKKYYDNAKLGAESLENILISFSEKDFKPKKFFINNSTDGTTIIFSIDSDTYSKEEFIDFAYNHTVELQQKHHDKDHNLHISFINDVEDFNIDLLKSEGFGFGYDITKGILIF